MAERMTLPLRVRRAAPAALVWAGALACAGGLVAARSWSVLPWRRCADSLLLALVAAALAAPLCLRRRWAWANGLAMVWLAALACFAGPLPLLAAALTGAAAIAAGTLLLPRALPAAPALALPIGLVLIAGTLGWLLPYPVHGRGVYVALLGGVCLVRARALGATVTAAWRDAQAAIRAEPRLAAAAIMLLGLASTGAWLPTMQADDLAYHLALPSELQRDGAYLADPAVQIWAFAPWLGDVVQAVAQVLAGGEARGAVDALWVASAAASLGALAAALGAGARGGWLVVAVFASLPPLAALAAGMQTELPATALLAAFALAVVLRDARLGAARAALAGGLVALKFGQAVAALVVLAWSVAAGRGKLDARRLPPALAVFALLAGSSYFRAWQATGNPMLPLFNDVFRASVLPPQQLDDPRWHAGFGPALPWSITFDTQRYLEAWNGGFGFALVALAGAWVLALVRAPTRGLTVAATMVALLPLVPMQYARYAFPGLVLLLPPLLAAADAALGPRRAAQLALALCALNLAFQANANWLLHVNAVRRLVADAGDASGVLGRYAPERMLAAEVRRRDPGDSIVLAVGGEAPPLAELGRRALGVSHYAPALKARGDAADADASGTCWCALIAATRARWLVLEPERIGDALRAGLGRCGAERALGVGGAELWSVGAADAGAR